MRLRTISLADFGTVEIHTESGETIAKSNLKHPQKHLIESIVLSHAIEGVDISSPSYASGLIHALRSN